MKVLRLSLEFEWDKGNQGKNLKHRVTDTECEEVFFDHNKKIAKDTFHSGVEERSILIGKTKYGRLMFVVFANRKHKIRIISAGNLNKKEQHLYEKET